MWGGGQIHLCEKHGTIGCGQCGEVVNCNVVENMFSLVVHVGRWLDKTLWKTWKIGCGQCGEEVNCSFVENMFLLVVPVGRWPDTTL